MRDNRDSWVFFKHRSKPTISSQETAYFKRMLSKILKIGMEFEFNLPDKNGTCKGNSNTCPCIHIQSGEDCWIECINNEGCLAVKSINRCMNVTGTCEPEDCESCEHYTIECSSIFCPSFVSKCFDCTSYQKECGNCKDKFDPNRSPDNIRSKIIQELSPNNCYGIINESGVHSITTDGSLLGKKGVEVITIGRRVDFWEFYNMAKNIIDTTIDKGGYINERCSIHMHMLASYYSKLLGEGVDSESQGVPTHVNELEKPMPQIILANYHQLRRRYQNALTWMSMGLDEPNRMTRWEKFRVSNLEISAILNDMKSVRDEVSKHSGGNKYGFTNYKFTRFDKTNGDVKRLHIEMRELDGILSPSAIAAIACMHYAMMIKAVEISRYGVLEVGDDEWMARAREIKEAILNNMKDYQEGDRFGNTKHVMKYREVLVNESLELVRQLKHILIKVGPAYQILEKIAERPMAIRRCDGESWTDIENELEIKLSEEDTYSMKINEVIDLRIIDQCNDIEEWINAVSSVLVNMKKEEPDLNIDEDAEAIERNIREFVETKQNDGEILWSTSLGSVVSL